MIPCCGAVRGKCHHQRSLAKPGDPSRIVHAPTPVRGDPYEDECESSPRGVGRSSGPGVRFERLRAIRRANSGRFGSRWPRRDHTDRRRGRSVWEQAGHLQRWHDRLRDGGGADDAGPDLQGSWATRRWLFPGDREPTGLSAALFERRTRPQTHQLPAAAATGAQTFQFPVPPASYTALYLILASGDGTASFTVTLSYAGGTPSTMTTITNLPDSGLGVQMGSLPISIS
jgi:hypothetical protein